MKVQSEHNSNYQNDKRVFLSCLWV